MIPKTETVLTFDRLAAALFFVAVAAAACLMPAQNDTWWHLRAGEDIWRAGGVPLRDTYSHTVYGTFWPDQEWLSEAIFYAIYRIGGLPLLTAAAATAAVATWAIVWRLTSASAWMRIALCALAVVPASIAWSLRPHLLTLLLVAVTAWCLVRRRLWILPGLFLVWANLHGGFMLGLVCLGAGTVWSALNDRRHLRTWALVTTASALTTNLTPLGLSEWPEILGALLRIRQYPINEWQPPGLFEPLFAPFWAAAAALLFVIVKHRLWRSTDAFGPLAWSAAAILPLAVTASRNVPPFLVLAVPVLASRVALPEGLLARSGRHERPRLNMALLGAAAVVACATVVYAWRVPLARLRWDPLPPDAIAAVRACPDPLYNRWDEGGFLIWFAPDRKVFIDGRQDPYPPELVAAHIRAEVDGEYESLFARFGIRCAFLPNSSPVATRLLEAGWGRRYDRAPWLVLARP